MQVIHRIKPETFKAALIDMIIHFDNVHNCFSDFTKFEYYATGYINVVFNLHKVSELKRFDSLRVDIIANLCEHHEYMDFRFCTINLLKRYDSYFDFGVPYDEIELPFN